MKKKIIISLFTLLLGVVCFTGCKNKKDNQGSQEPAGPTYVDSTVTNVVTSGEKDNYYKVEGIVFSKEADFFYISDGTTNIRVSKSNHTVAKGDKVEVKAKLSVSSDRPYLSSPEISVLASGQTAISPSAATISEIAGLSSKNKSVYSKYYTVEGWVTKGDSNYALNQETSDTEYKSVLLSSNTVTDDVMEDYKGKFVQMNIIVDSYSSSSSKYICTTDGATIVDKTPALTDEVTNKVIPQLKTVLDYDATGNKYKDIYGSMQLPLKHANKYVNGLTYSWVAKEYTEATVENQVVRTYVDAFEKKSLTKTVFDKSGVKAHVYTFADDVYTACTSATYSDSKTYYIEKYEKVTVTSDSFAELKAKLFTTNTDKIIYTAVASADEFDSTKEYYTRAISNGGFAIGDDGDVVITSPTTIDKKVELTLTVTRGEDTTTQVIDVVSKVIPDSRIPNILDDHNPFYNYTHVKLTGVVIAKSQNQSGNSYGLIIADEDAKSKSIQVDVDFETFIAYELNDVIKVDGYYRNVSNDRRTITSRNNKNLVLSNTSLVKTLTDANKWTYGNAVLVVDSAEDYKELIENYDEKYVGRLVKFVNPYLALTTRSGGNTIDISYKADDNTMVEAVNINGGTKTVQACFVTSRIDAMFGTTAWRQGITEEAKKVEVTIYAIPSYYSGIAIFTIPTADQITFTNANDQITYEINKNLKDLIRLNGNIDLPTTVKYGSEDVTLNWTSENPTVISDAGVCTYTNADQTAELCAAFTLADETEGSATIKITLASNTPVKIGALGADNDGKYVLVEGQVVAYATSGSYSTAGAARTGYVLMDQETGEVVYTTKTNQLGGTLFNGFEANKTKIKIGDVLRIYGMYYNDSENPGSGVEGINNGRHVIDCSELTIVSFQNTTATVDLALDSAKSKIKTVTNDTELAALVDSGVPFGTVIKFVGTKDNPIHFQCASTDDLVDHSKTVNLRFCYDGESGTTTKKYDCNYAEGEKVTLTFGLTALANELTKDSFKLDDASSYFWEQLGFTSNLTTKVVDSKTVVDKLNIKEKGNTNDMECVGTFYAVVGYVNSTYYHMSLVDPANTWKMENINAQTVGKITVSSFIYGDGKIDNLPSKTMLNKDIVWTIKNGDSNYEIADGSLKKKSTGSAETITANYDLTLVASVEVNGENIVCEKKITIEKPAVKGWAKLTVSELANYKNKEILLVATADNKTYTYKASSGTSKTSSACIQNTASEVTLNADGTITFADANVEKLILVEGKKTTSKYGFKTTTAKNAKYDSLCYFLITSSFALSTQSSLSDNGYDDFEAVSGENGTISLTCSDRSNYKICFDTSTKKFSACTEFSETMIAVSIYAYKVIG